MTDELLLLIDDETPLRQAIARMLELEGYTVLQAATAHRGLELLREHADEVMVILSDVKLPDGYGLDLLARYRQLTPVAEIILLTAYGTIPDGVRAMREGAFDYLTKGDSDDQLVVVVSRAVEKARLQRRVLELERKVDAQFGFDAMIGRSKALLEVKRTAQQVAQTDATVLLVGPTGAGKELFAQAIHQGSPRRAKPFVALNCSAFPKELLESELFGYKKGAFTGAQADKKGLMEAAHGGTLFLDEIGELDIALQAKLLRALETQTFTRVGDTAPRRVDVRLVAATNRNLRQEADQGHFRADLYYRLAVVELPIPALRARAEDIAPLAAHFLRQFATKLRRTPVQLTPDALQLLEQYAWPGNVRELKNVLERLSILWPADQPLTADGLPLELQLAVHSGSPSQLADDQSLRSFERQHIQRVLLECHGNKAEAARRLGVALTTLYRKLQEYQL